MRAFLSLNNEMNSRFIHATMRGLQALGAGKMFVRYCTACGVPHKRETHPASSET
jgi:hypothetical protein